MATHTKMNGEPVRLEDCFFFLISKKEGKKEKKKNNHLSSFIVALPVGKGSKDKKGERILMKNIIRK